jgi:RecB family endonuclease NucS
MTPPPPSRLVRLVRLSSYRQAMRLIVARCEVRYTGRLEALLPEALRLVMIKSDGSVMVQADTGGYKPQNWMTPPTMIEELDGSIVVRKRAGATEDRLDITITEVLSDVTHDMGEAAALEKEGAEVHLQELLADAPQWCGEGFRLVRREWPTDIGPVDLMCRDEEDEWIAVEIKRVGTIDAVEQLTRYLERIRLDPAMDSCRGVLAAQVIKPQARVLAQARRIDCVEVDLAVLRREREPDLTLFAA